MSAYSTPSGLLRQRAIVWLAVALTLFAALAPAVTQAMSVARAAEAGLIPVCTQAGMKWMDIKSGEIRNASDDSGQSERCSFCLSSPPSLALTTVGATFAVPDFSRELPYLFEHAPHTLFVWAHAQSRAPPARA